MGRARHQRRVQGSIQVLPTELLGAAAGGRAVRSPGGPASEGQSAVPWAPAPPAPLNGGLRLGTAPSPARCREREAGSELAGCQRAEQVREPPASGHGPPEPGGVA